MIDPISPHQLRLPPSGNSIGADTLSLRADLGGGFVASGELIVNVVEPIDDQTMELRIVPNPINPQYLRIDRCGHLHAKASIHLLVLQVHRQT